jgi:metal-responsive CopG/Arc/MetJ family transcriptional regulator
VTLKVPKPLAARVDEILKRKPHWSQQSVIIDAIEAGLAQVEAREKAS